jgi:Tfp pilus assembly protein PilW
MDRSRPLSPGKGFSIVEMMVALLFTMILMAGLGVVFKSSLSVFYTSGERLASIRRNQMSTDLLYDDLNSAGMSLVDLSSPLASGSTNPAFYIIPNVSITGAGPNDPQTTDELYLAFDQALPFEAAYKKGGGGGGLGSVAAEKVLSGDGVVPDDTTYEIDCRSDVYAGMVKPGMRFHIKDELSNPALEIESVVAPSNSQTITIKTITVPSEGTQVGQAGDPTTQRAVRRVQGSGVIFILPKQMVRYRIVMQKLDPSAASEVPCLIREQGTYNPDAAFVPAGGAETQIIAENVSGFKAYLSANSGTDWAGTLVTATGMGAGWTNGIQKALDSQLLSIGRQDYTNTSSTSWYRDIPVLLRLDITTRTATQREEYSQVAKQLAYKEYTQSLVLLPRHFGLTM